MFSRRIKLAKHFLIKGILEEFKVKFIIIMVHNRVLVFVKLVR
jgi:hypothetical protein